MTYNLFISHSWSYSDHYERLVALLNRAPGFHYRNYSVPRNDPVHTGNNDLLLAMAIRRQMEPASCVLILAGVYATYSRWINIEILLAKELDKRIIAVAPWGSERISTVVRQNADAIVRWNTDSIVRAIRG